MAGDAAGTTDSTIVTYLVQMNPAKLGVPRDNLEGFAFIFYQSMMNLTNLATGKGVPGPRTIVDTLLPEAGEEEEGATQGEAATGACGRAGGTSGTGAAESVTVEEMLAAVKEEATNAAAVPPEPKPTPAATTNKNTGGFFKLTARRGSAPRVHPV